MLKAWALLQLEIATAKQAPGQIVDITPATVTKSKGYRELFAFAQRLPKVRRRTFIAGLKGQIDGIREVIAKAKATGEDLSMADIVIEVRDAGTGEPITEHAGVRLERVKRCTGTGKGIGDLIAGATKLAACPDCGQRWNAYDIGFAIPEHEPQATADA